MASQIAAGQIAAGRFTKNYRDKFGYQAIQTNFGNVEVLFLKYGITVSHVIFYWNRIIVSGPTFDRLEIGQVMIPRNEGYERYDVYGISIHVIGGGVISFFTEGNELIGICGALNCKMEPYENRDKGVPKWWNDIANYYPEIAHRVLFAVDSQHHYVEKMVRNASDWYDSEIIRRFSELYEMEHIIVGKAFNSEMRKWMKCIGVCCRKMIPALYHHFLMMHNPTSTHWKKYSCEFNILNGSNDFLCNSCNIVVQREYAQKCKDCQVEKVFVKIQYSVQPKFCKGCANKPDGIARAEFKAFKNGTNFNEIYRFHKYKKMKGGNKINQDREQILYLEFKKVEEIKKLNGKYYNKVMRFGKVLPIHEINGQFRSEIKSVNSIYQCGTADEVVDEVVDDETTTSLMKLPPMKLSLMKLSLTGLSLMGFSLMKLPPMKSPLMNLPPMKSPLMNLSSMELLMMKLPPMKLPLMELPLMKLPPMKLPLVGLSFIELSPMELSPMGLSPMKLLPMGLSPMGLSPMELSPMELSPMGLPLLLTDGIVADKVVTSAD